MFHLWLGLKTAAHSAHALALALAEKYQAYPGVTRAWILSFATCLWQLDPTFFHPLRQDGDGFLREYAPQQVLATMACPGLFLRGEPALGAVMTEEELAWLPQHGRPARCAQIGGVGHLLHLQDHGAQPVLAEMLTFLESLPK